MKENLAAKEGLIQKLQALQNMTVANGCTESEALVAAGKAAELLERYGLSMEELKAAAPNQLCDQNSLDCRDLPMRSNSWLRLSRNLRKQKPGKLEPAPRCK
jgi:hypothetical protein